MLASIGVYGVPAYLTGQRTPEIGVRMAVGPNVRDIMQLVLWQGLKMVLTLASPFASIIPTRRASMVTP